MRSIKVGIAGLGFVGRETVRLLLANRAEFSRRLGAEISLRAVCDRDVEAESRRLHLPRAVRRIFRYADFAKDPEIDIIVELFGGLEEARKLVFSSLASGKHVVTANKRLLSCAWPKLWRAARAADKRVYFEAAVAGGIPIISALRSGLAADKITKVMGIFNGTTNYILSQMAHQGCEMTHALGEAQRLGMAEKDPALDLNGMDTAHKVSVLASLLTKHWVHPEKIARQGIESVDAEDIRFAVSKLGRTVRLIGTVAINWNSRPLGLETHVQPTLIGLEHPLAAVHGGYNAALVSTSPAGDLMFYGKGAGPGPAASAVMGDVLMLSQDILSGRGADPDFAPSARESKMEPTQESPASFYLKLRVRDVPGALAKITGLLGRSRISIAQIHQDIQQGTGNVSVMIVTHATDRRAIEKARAAILALPMVERKHSCLRILPD